MPFQQILLAVELGTESKIPFIKFYLKITFKDQMRVDKVDNFGLAQRTCYHRMLGDSGEPGKARNCKFLVLWSTSVIVTTVILWSAWTWFYRQAVSGKQMNVKAQPEDSENQAGTIDHLILEEKDQEDMATLASNIPVQLKIDELRMLKQSSHNMNLIKKVDSGRQALVGNLSRERDELDAKVNIPLPGKLSILEATNYQLLPVVKLTDQPNQVDQELQEVGGEDTDIVQNDGRADQTQGTNHHLQGVLFIAGEELDKRFDRDGKAQVAGPECQVNQARDALHRPEDGYKFRPAEDRLANIDGGIQGLNKTETVFEHK